MPRNNGDDLSGVFDEIAPEPQAEMPQQDAAAEQPARPVMGNQAGAMIGYQYRGVDPAPAEYANQAVRWEPEVSYGARPPRNPRTLLADIDGCSLIDFRLKAYEQARRLASTGVLGKVDHTEIINAAKLIESYLFRPKYDNTSKSK